MRKILAVAARLADGHPIDPVDALVASRALRLAHVLLEKEREIMDDPFAVFDRGPFGERVVGAMQKLKESLA